MLALAIAMGTVLGDDRLCAAQPEPASSRGCRLARHHAALTPLGKGTAIARPTLTLRAEPSPSRHFAGDSPPLPVA